MNTETSQCPICRRPAAPRPGNRSFPFCSRRCQMVDLGKWLGEEYRVSVPIEDEADAEPGMAPAARGRKGDPETG